eukprot:14354936-Alexandrium_andersonii.AAC.1
MSVRSLLFGAANGAAPQRRSPAWAASRDEITSLAGLSRAPRSWQELYRVLRGRTALVAATWGQVLGDVAPAELRQRWCADRHASGEAASWNPRWQVSHDARSAAAKRAVI